MIEFHRKKRKNNLKNGNIVHVRDGKSLRLATVKVAKTESGRTCVVQYNSKLRRLGECPVQIENVLIKQQNS